MVAAGVIGAALVLPGGTLGTAANVASAASILLFGLPHGAADWWVMRLAARGRWTAPVQIRSATVYIGAALLTLGLWRFSPAVALPGFFALTAWHFGSADASVLLPERRTFRDAIWWTFAVGRGLLVIFTSLAFRPMESARVLAPFAGLGPGVAASLDGLLKAALPLVWIGATLQIAAIRLDARANRRRFTYNVLEICLLLMLFRIAPPLLAFMGYWIAFHAWRHILRLETSVMPPPGEAPRPWWRTVADFHRRTLGLTLASLPGLALIFWLWPDLRRSGQHAVVAYLILLSVLTVPHAVVIGWLDRRRMKDEG